MTSGQFFETIKSHPWWKTILDDRTKAAPSLASYGERAMLYWLARHIPLHDHRCFVDAGSFLGGSTVAMAAGLRDNNAGGRRNSKIIAYDLFISSGSDLIQELAGRNKRAGETLIDVFYETLGGLKSMTVAISGDFHFSPPPRARIDFMFVDIAKSWSLNSRVVADYFSQLAVDAVLVQKDYNHHSCPWINLTMAYFDEYFEYIQDEQSSRIFRVRKPIPLNKLSKLDLQALPLPKKMALMKKAIEAEQSEASRYHVMVSAGWLIYEDEGVESAIDYLRSVRQEQPWKSTIPYVDRVIEIMQPALV